MSCWLWNLWPCPILGTEKASRIAFRPAWGVYPQELILVRECSRQRGRGAEGNLLSLVSVALLVSSPLLGAPALERAFLNSVPPQTLTS